MPEEYFAINHSMSRRTPSTMDSAGILAEVVALNGAKGTITLGTGTWRIDLATVTPANVRLVPEQGAMLTKVGSGTLTINGPFEAPLAQVFSGFAAGEVTLGKLVGDIYSEWFGAIGDDTADDTSAIQSAVSSSGGNGVVRLLPRVYRLSSAITLPVANGTVFTLKGYGNNASSGVVSTGTVIRQVGAGVNGISAISTGSANPRLNLEGFTVLGPDIWDQETRSATSGDGINITGKAVPVLRMRDITISNFIGSGKVGLRIDNVENSAIDSVSIWNCAKGFQIGDVGTADPVPHVTSANVFSNIVSHQNIVGGTIDGSTGDTWSDLCVQSSETSGLIISAGSLLTFNNPWLENNNTESAPSVYGLLLQSSATKYVGQVRIVNAMLNVAADSVQIVGHADNPIRSVVFSGGYSGAATVNVDVNVIGATFERPRFAVVDGLGAAIVLPYDSNTVYSANVDAGGSYSLYVGATHATSMYMGHGTCPIKVMSGLAGSLAGSSPTNGGTVTFDCRATNVAYAYAGPGVASFTVANPTYPVGGQELTIEIVNASGGYLTVSWGSDFRMAAWPSVANGYSQTIRFFFDTSTWREISRSAAFAN